MFFMAAAREEIEQVGNQAIATVYGCKHCSDLNLERASRFTEKEGCFKFRLSAS
jgi:hypothetical protein